MRTEILGVGFDALTADEALLRASGLLGRGGYIVTANPEILLQARADRSYAAAVNGGTLVLADGVGDLLAGRILGRPLPQRVTGADLTARLLDELARRGGSVFLYGARPGVAARAAEKLEKTFPGLRIAGTENGYISSEEGLLSALRSTAPELLLVGLGAPRQERWMAAHTGELNGTLMIGVGGYLDVLAGDVRRAPEAWQRLGLEWLFRLLQEPKRLARVAKLPGFLLLALGERGKCK